MSDFVLGNVFGQGGSGFVQVAQIRNPDLLRKHRKRLGSDQVAIKFYKLDADKKTSDIMNEFKFELAVMGQLCSNGHPNLVTLVGYLDEPNPGIAMKKYMGSLRDVLRNTEGFPTLSPEMVATWAKEISNGMMEIHR